MNNIIFHVLSYHNIISINSIICKFISKYQNFEYKKQSNKLLLKKKIIMFINVVVVVVVFL